MAGDSATVQKRHPRKVKIGPYEVVGRPLGSGGSARVWKAVDEDGKEYAIKELLPENLSQKETVKRFRHEFNIVKELDHPNIVNILDFFRANGTYNLVMEFVDGLDLKTIIRRTGPLEPKLAFSIAYHSARCLHYVHEQGLVHRDIKPENILVKRDGVLKLTDFGIARMEDIKLTRTGYILGTPAYMSPEQLAGKVSSEIDGRTDIYSLGIVLYEMLTGRDPYGLKGNEEILRVINIKQKKTPKPLKMNDAEAEEIVMQMLARLPEDRFQSAAELAAALKPYSQGEDATCRELKALMSGVEEKVKKRAAAGAKSAATVLPTDQRGLWALLIALLILLGGFLGWLYYHPQDKTPAAQVPGISISDQVNDKLRLEHK